MEQNKSSRERLFAGWMQKVEAAAPGIYRDIFTCADEDREFFQQNDPQKKLKLPMIRCGVDPAAYLVAPETRNRIRRELQLADEDWLIVFSGSNYGPNVEALESLREFCRRESAFLAARRIQFLALGSMTATAAREPGIIATGRVPEVAPYFAAGDAGFNPITRGSGSNVKLFEYLATRLPVISTEFGVRGTTLQAGSDYLSFDWTTLKDTLERFVTMHSHQGWRQQAELVWQRNRATCDIQLIVETAVAQLPEFDS